MQNFVTPPPPPRPVGPQIAWRSCKPMPWRVPPVGGSYRGSASKPPPNPPPSPLPPPSPHPPSTPFNPAALPPLFLQNPLSPFPVLGPARGARKRLRLRRKVMEGDGRCMARSCKANAQQCPSCVLSTPIKTPSGWARTSSSCSASSRVT